MSESVTYTSSSTFTVTWAEDTTSSVSSWKVYRRDVSGGDVVIEPEDIRISTAMVPGQGRTYGVWVTALSGTVESLPSETIQVTTSKCGVLNQESGQVLGPS